MTAGFFFFLQMASGALYSALLGALHLGSVPSLLWAVVLPQGALTAAFALSRLRGSGV
ncbi:hypothetical protein H7347_10135 [Corynebacterium sp. zg-331]|uniref:hypothetical protein n=1 Tax=unclassified Corynebacterium TaxID=2624378 RepID=UPI0016433DAB|nr:MULTISPECIES: hypothetical protein [unclassified Corynebacterium]MBC3186916.1 hypothetical protein [Corynebacterium sp. zg-331]